MSRSGAAPLLFVTGAYDWWWGQDTKNKYIPHKACTYYIITSAWSVYCSFTQLFVIFIAFGQLDLLLVRLASDLAANYVTLSFYLHGKIYDPDLHLRGEDGMQKPEEEVEMECRGKHAEVCVGQEGESEHGALLLVP